MLLINVLPNISELVGKHHNHNQSSLWGPSPQHPPAKPIATHREDRSRILPRHLSRRREPQDELAILPRDVGDISHKSKIPQ